MSFQAQGRNFGIRFLRVLGCGLSSLSVFYGVLGEACQVPVFRYALERWTPADYQITVSVADAQGGEVQRTLKPLREAVSGTEWRLNARLEIKGGGGSSKNVLRIFTPQRRGVEGEGWEGRLDEASVENLVDSPARAELQRRLLNGESAVWMFLRGGDEAKDAEARAVLRDGLKRAEQRIRLPEGATSVILGESGASQELMERLPLRIAFSVIEVDPSEPAEGALVEMLRRVERDLNRFEGEPMAYAVFGRGRALEPLIGKGIREENILEQLAYVCGACSCEVKDQNPGMDLLMRARWDLLDTAPQVEEVRIVPTPEDSAIEVSIGRPSRIWVWGLFGVVSLGLLFFVKSK